MLKRRDLQKEKVVAKPWKPWKLNGIEMVAKPRILDRDENIKSFCFFEF